MNLIGYQSAPQDTRDFIFGASLMRPEVIDHDWEVPLIQTDLRQHTGSVENQTTTNSCVGKSTISACEVLLSQAGRFEDLSSLFVYYNGRAKHGTPVQDRGTNFRSVLSEATKQGVCSLSAWPYEPSRVNEKPSQTAYTNGAGRLVTRYERIGSLGKDGFGNNVIDPWRIISDTRVALAAGYPVLFAVALHKSFLSLKGSMHFHNYTTETITSQHPEYAGHHAMLVVGNTKTHFIIENSWGTGWGDNGYTMMRFDAFGRNVEANDGFVIREFAGLRKEIPENWVISRSMQSPLHDQQIRDFVIPVVTEHGPSYAERMATVNEYARKNKISRPRMAQAVGETLSTVNKYLDGLW